MSLIEMPVFTILDQVLRFHNFRHDIISGNIANANTPGYSAFEAVLQEAIDGARPVAPRTTDPRHLSMSSDLDATGARLFASRAPARLDGNNVDPDQEATKLIENQTRYLVGIELRDRLGSFVQLAREVR